VIHKRAANTSEPPTKPPKRVHQLQPTMAPPKQAISSNNEGRIDLAKQEIKLGQIQSVLAAAEVFDIKRETLRDRINGIPSRRDCTPNSRKLTPYEEEAVVQYILDLDLRGFPPRPRDVQEMANLLLAERGGILVGKN
jgi:hypothetical protein